MIKELTKEVFEQEIKTKKELAVVDVFANWCGPCKTMAPVFERVAKEFEGRVSFYKNDIDKEREIATAFGITSIPSFLFFKKGEVVAKEFGVIDEDSFKDMVNEHLLGD